ncbi:FadR/GntR family transcriptional regulator [Duganella callida]|uniref:FadR family transcriptional regulator n=1 Tax=Duganella callida TaxID=2561932 RepID=A0A4Y9SKU2_9BURK|nr:FCD domain-containing protein [Duganella callida]TFW23857.1 FadR family transcriptional regulator [Duganella callida]
MSEMNVRRVQRKPHLAEHVVAALSEEIASGRLRHGDRLPTEQFLAENFGVSRNVVREAIASLRSQGLIQSRQGVGAFVSVTAEAAAEPLAPVSAQLLEGDDTIRKMFEVRAALESQAAALAAAGMTPRKLKEIRDAVERMRFEGAPTATTVNADLDFHRAVAAASGNDYLEAMIRTVLEPMRPLIAANFSRHGPMFGNIPHAARDEHEALVQAFIDKDAALARRLMGEHIVSAAARFGYEIAHY